MPSHEALAGLDLEDLTPRQLRQLLRGAARHSLLRRERDDKEVEKEDDKASSENDDLVNLHEEKTGKSNVPKVKADDLPEGVEMEEDCDDCDEDDKSSKYRKKAKK